jgi:hypothetical protein
MHPQPEGLLMNDEWQGIEWTHAKRQEPEDELNRWRRQFMPKDTEETPQIDEIAARRNPAWAHAKRWEHRVPHTPCEWCGEAYIGSSGSHGCKASETGKARVKREYDEYQRRLAQQRANYLTQIETEKRSVFRQKRLDLGGDYVVSVAAGGVPIFIPVGEYFGTHSFDAEEIQAFLENLAENDLLEGGRPIVDACVRILREYMQHVIDRAREDEEDDTCEYCGEEYCDSYYCPGPDEDEDEDDDTGSMSIDELESHYAAAHLRAIQMGKEAAATAAAQRLTARECMFVARDGSTVTDFNGRQHKFEYLRPEVRMEIKRKVRAEYAGEALHSPQYDWLRQNHEDYRDYVADSAQSITSPDPEKRPLSELVEREQELHEQSEYQRLAAEQDELLAGLRTAAVQGLVRELDEDANRFVDKADAATKEIEGLEAFIAQKQDYEFAHDVLQPEVTAMKFDSTKVRYDLLPAEALLHWALSMTYGVFKYEEWNWANGIQASKYYGALQRHLMSWWTGESYDPETGGTVHHLGQVMFAAACLLTLELRGTLIDDRRMPTAPLEGNIPPAMVVKGLEAKAKALGVDAVELAAEAGVDLELLRQQLLDHGQAL